MFIGTVVITRDGARTNIGVGTNAGIAHIGKMIRLSTRTQDTIFYFYEITDFGLFTKFCARPQSRIGADLALWADNSTINVAERMDNSVLTNAAVFQYAIGFDNRAITDNHIPFDNHIDV